MALISHLPHTCSTERAAAPTGIYGQNRETWAPHLKDVRCRLVIKEQQGAAGTEHEGTVISTYKLLLPRRTDIKQGDRITSVQDKDVVLWGPFTIKEVLPRRSRSIHHIALSLERVQA